MFGWPAAYAYSFRLPRFRELWHDPRCRSVFLIVVRLQLVSRRSFGPLRYGWSESAFLAALLSLFSWLLLLSMWLLLSGCFAVQLDFWIGSAVNKHFHTVKVSILLGQQLHLGLKSWSLSAQSNFVTLFVIPREPSNCSPLCFDSDWDRLSLVHSHLRGSEIYTSWPHWVFGPCGNTFFAFPPRRYQSHPNRDVGLSIGLEATLPGPSSVSVSVAAAGGCSIYWEGLQYIKLFLELWGGLCACGVGS